VKKRKTKQNRSILGVCSFAALEVRLTIGMSPGTTSNSSAARSQGDELRMVKDTQRKGAASSKDTAITATRPMLCSLLEMQLQRYLHGTCSAQLIDGTEPSELAGERCVRLAKERPIVQ